MQLLKEADNIWLFPVQISIIRGVLNSAQCKDIVSYYRPSIVKKHNALIGEAYSSHDGYTHILEEIDKQIPSCKGLQLNIQGYFNRFAKEYGMTELLLTDSWINFQYKESVLKEHTHPGADVSSALYLEADDNSSQLFFHNPNPFNKFSHYVTETDLNMNTYSIKPEVGDLIIFPSWLTHGSNQEKNLSHERVVMSINARH